MPKSKCYRKNKEQHRYQRSKENIRGAISEVSHVIYAQEEPIGRKQWRSINRVIRSHGKISHKTNNYQKSRRVKRSHRRKNPRIKPCNNTTSKNLYRRNFIRGSIILSYVNTAQTPN